MSASSPAASAPRPATTRLATAAFWALCLTFLAWSALLVSWEPVVGDGWGHLPVSRRGPLTLDTYWLYVKSGYLGGNPRLGQAFTLLTYTDTPLHLIVTPLVELALFVLIAILVRGRGLSPRRLEDTWLLAVVIALTFIAVPQVGPMLFYRPFTTNYLYGFVLQLAFLVPYRLQLGVDRGRRPGTAGAVAGGLAALGMPVLGVVAGLTNEHTGPSLLVGLAIFAWLHRRHGGRFAPWMVSGAVGFLAGYLLLFFAPGQSYRYGNLAQQQSIVELILDRGVAGNAAIIGLFVLEAMAMAPLVLVAGVLFRRRRREAAGPAAAPALTRARWIEVAIYVGLGVAMIVTLLASPKQGTRLHFASMMLVIAAVAMVLDDLARDRVVRRVVAVMAALILLAIGGYLGQLYHRLHGEHADRMTALRTARRGTVVTVPLYSQVDGDRWFLGDDFISAPLRQRLARKVFRLAAIELSGVAPSSYSLDLTYTLSPEPKVSPLPDDLEIPTTPSLARAFFTDVVRRLARLRGKPLRAAALRVERLDLPELKGRPLVIARWFEGKVLAPQLSLGRRARLDNIEVRSWPIDPAGTPPIEIYVALPGDKTLATDVVTVGAKTLYTYTPWKSGTYVVIACDPTTCYLAETVTVDP